MILCKVLIDFRGGMWSIHWCLIECVHNGHFEVTIAILRLNVIPCSDSWISNTSSQSVMPFEIKVFDRKERRPLEIKTRSLRKSRWKGFRDEITTTLNIEWQVRGQSQSNCILKYSCEACPFNVMSYQMNLKLRFTSDKTFTFKVLTFDARFDCLHNL